MVEYCKKLGNERLVKTLGCTMLACTVPRVESSVCTKCQANQQMFNIIKCCRKDRYNKKIEKYYVVYEEGDESLSEDEERMEEVNEEVGFLGCGSSFMPFSRASI